MVAVQASLYAGNRHHCPRPCGASATELKCGPTTAQIDAAGTCYKAVRGEQCFTAVTWALQHGLRESPSWYLTSGQ